MNNKEFVSFLRVYLSDKKKLTKSETEELKKLLGEVYNELPQDIVFKEWTDKRNVQENSIYCRHYPHTISARGYGKCFCAG